MTQPILNCAIHDYLEVACLYQIPVRIKLNDRRLLTGTCITTKIRRINDESGAQLKEEFLVFEERDTKRCLDLVLTDIHSMKAVENNTYFSVVLFSND